MKIAVFTVCMPADTPESAAAKLAKWGYDGVEWRIHPLPPESAAGNFWTGNRCSIDPEALADEAPQIRKLCRRHKLAMPTLASYLGYEQLPMIERVMEGARRLGVKQMRVGVPKYDGSLHYDKLVRKTLRGWEKVVKLGKKYKVKPLAEIHMGNIICSCSAARRFMEHFKPTETGIIHDAGNMIYEGYENWKMGLEVLGKYLAHVHVKNASWSISHADRDGGMIWRPVSDTFRRGRVNWEEVLVALKQVGYDGWLSLEDFGPGQQDEKLIDDINYLRTILKRSDRKI